MVFFEVKVGVGEFGVGVVVVLDDVGDFGVVGVCCGGVGGVKVGGGWGGCGVIFGEG